MVKPKGRLAASDHIYHSEKSCEVKTFAQCLQSWRPTCSLQLPNVLTLTQKTILGHFLSFKTTVPQRESTCSLCFVSFLSCCNIKTLQGMCYLIL